MKNQYFGDINDYRKYGLLRNLGPRAGLSLGVCWMLTPDDGRSDGKFIQYLEKPGEWSARDPELFQELKRIVQTEEIRDVGAIELGDLLPGARFYSEIVPTDTRKRLRYMSECLESLFESDLLFFDPDNGMEIESVVFGTKDSLKYLYWRELEAAFDAGHSVLVYQHFPRVKRKKFVSELAAEFQRRTGVGKITSFSTAHVVFFLIPQARHQEALERATEAVSREWRDEITVAVHEEIGDRFIFA